MSILSVKNLKISFKSQAKFFTAVDGISFDLNKNEILGLLGESGSGKTLTAYSIMGILPAHNVVKEGHVVFSGQDLLLLNNEGMNRIRGKKIGIVFQEPFSSLNPVMRIGEQIDEIFSNNGGARKNAVKQKTIQILESVRIKDPERIYSSYPHQLSGGQRQRVVIGMAIALKPDILIADEPTTALDATVQKDIIELLMSLKQEYKFSILFITHDFNIAGKICDRLLILKEGRIVEEGSKANVMHSPKEDYTKQLLGAVPKISKIDNIDFKKNKPLITLKNVSKKFTVEKGFLRQKKDSVYAVRNVSFQIEKGITVGLVGESGCGKSTLARLILGIESADEGNILIDNHQLFSKNQVDRAIRKKITKFLQIVFQDPFSSLDPRLKMKDVVLEGPLLFGVEKDKRKEILKDVLEKVKIPLSSSEKYPHEFSGGQRQRIAIARALAVNPRIIVFDEPLSSLDVLVQKSIMDLLKTLKSDNDLTYLFISHDLRVISEISDKIVVMNDGRIVEIGTPSRIFDNPENAYTKKLISSLI